MQRSIAAVRPDQRVVVVVVGYFERDDQAGTWGTARPGNHIRSPFTIWPRHGCTSAANQIEWGLVGAQPNA
jgi:hypothetical protein